MTTPQLFGTDGIRAHFSSAVLRPESVVRLGRILAHRIKDGFFSPPSITSRPFIIIGRDTRLSGLYLEHALLAGLAASGIDCVVLGVIPTSAIAYFTKTEGAALGIMISASHNPYYDNGLKVFDARGFKISEAEEKRITDDYSNFDDQRFLISQHPGEIRYFSDAKDRYAKLLLSAFDETLDCTGLRIVLDCAHGAASGLAHEILRRTGATVISTSEFVMGKDINRDCGSEAPAVIKQEVIKNNADIGIAFDGDADRVIFVDERGEIIDGDAIIATMAQDAQANGRLAHNTVVATIMSSLALDNALSPHNINVVRTTVGDKYVARAMLEQGFTFGGENSGHLIMFPYTTTGDGIFSALQFVMILKKSQQTASQVVIFFTPTPKILKNIIIDEKIPLDELPLTQEAIMQANGRLKAHGRVMLRYSGTENKARLLVEAPTTHDCERIAHDIGEAFLAEVAAQRRAS